MAAPPDGSDTATVLIVDDERNVADLYATWVEMEADYETRVVYDGESALEALVASADDETGADAPTAAVDAMLLDRRMPGMAGDEVLETLRDRGYDVPVAMVTAVKPEDAPLEGDYQEYLTKPVMRDDVGRVVETLVAYDPADDAAYPESDDAATTVETADSPEDGADADDPDGQVSEDVRETLDTVTERLDQIQESVDPEAEDSDDPDEDDGEDGVPDSDPDDDLVTAEDIRTKVSETDDTEES